MSSTSHAGHGHHGHHDGHHGNGHHGDGHHDDGHHDGDAMHISFKGYMTGFVLAAILTIIPFWLVMGKVFDSSLVTGIVVLAIGAVQIVVHMIYFLHMNSRIEAGWSMLSLIFTTVIVVIALAGSIWVMYHLNDNVMPSHQQMRTRP